MLAASLARESDRPIQPHSQPPVRGTGTIVVAEYPLNAHETFRAEIITRDGKPVVAISRWKHMPTGPRRTGSSLEFGAHRTAAVSNLLVEVQRVLEALNKGGAQ